jgi:lactate permease
MLSGSDRSGNALFGNLQVVAARQLDLNPVLSPPPIRRAA